MHAGVGVQSAVAEDSRGFYTRLFNSLFLVLSFAVDRVMCVHIGNFCDWLIKDGPGATPGRPSRTTSRHILFVIAGTSGKEPAIPEPGNW